MLLMVLTGGTPLLPGFSTIEADPFRRHVNPLLGGGSDGATGAKLVRTVADAIVAAT